MRFERIVLLIVVTFTMMLTNVYGEKDDHITLKGVVIDSLSNMAVPAACIWVEDGPFYKQGKQLLFTDQHGGFISNRIIPGVVKLTVYVTGTGTYTRTLDLKDSVTTVRLLVGEKMSEKQDADSLSYFGIVVSDAESGVPVKRAMIEIDANQYIADENGVLIIFSKSDIKGVLSIKAPGYFDTTGIKINVLKNSAFMKTVFLKKDSSYNVGWVAGCIVDSTGKLPIKDVKFLEIITGNACKTDSAGTFVSRPLIAGQYSFIIIKDKYENKILKNIIINAGDTVALDTIAISKKTGTFDVPIHIKVKDENSNDLDGAIVILSGAEDSPFITDSAGSVHIRRMPGVYSMTSAADGFDTISKQIIVMHSDTALFEMMQLRSRNEAHDTTNGKVTGIVFEQSEKTPLSGIRVMTAEGVYSAITDRDGRYLISGIPPGMHVIVAESEAYILRQAINITVNKMSKIEQNLFLEKKDVQEMQKVVVINKRSKSTTAGLLADRKERLEFSDQFGAEQMNKAAAGNAAEAMRYIPGLSVIDDKYVVVRGMSDRFVSNRFEGVEIPSPNPDRVAFNYNLFPSGVIDNITISKTYSVEYPGNFSGGVVDVKTREIPEELTIALTGSIAGNTRVTFQDIFAEKEGKLDWLGFDDGTRQIPDVLRDIDKPLPEYNEWMRVPVTDTALQWQLVKRADEAVKSFKTEFDPHVENALPDGGGSILIGKKGVLLNRHIGFMLAANYSNTIRSYMNGVQINWNQILGDETLIDSLDKETQYTDSKSIKERAWITMAKTELEVAPGHSLDLYYNYTRNAESMARYAWSTFIRGREIQNGIFEQQETRYTQRGLSFLLLRGEHKLNEQNILTWRGNISNGIQDEPDYRPCLNNKMVTDSGDSVIQIRTSAGALPFHTFRKTTEDSKLFSIDHTGMISLLNDGKLTFKNGVYLLSKERKFNQLRFYYIEGRYSKLPEEIGKDIDVWLAEDNVGLITIDSTINGPRKYRVGNIITWDRNLDTSVTHRGEHTQWALYTKTDYEPVKNLVVTAGIRYEPYKISIISRNRAPDFSGLREKEMLSFSAGINYTIIENMISRLSFSRTTNLPSYREIAPFGSVDPVTLRDERGNPILKPAEIFNYDARWEWFFGPAQILAISGFYKYIQNPIDKLPLLISGTGQIQPQNSKNAQLLGCEIEGNVRLEKIIPRLRSWTVGGNFTLMKTTVVMSDSITARLGRTSSERPLPNSSPYVINVNIQYDNPDKNASLACFLNVFGPRLVYASSTPMPDCYEFPRPELNLTASKKLSNRLNFKLSIKNCLDTKYRDGYTYKGKRYYNQVYYKGIKCQTSVSYNF